MLIIILASITTVLALAAYISLTTNPLFHTLINLDDPTSPQEDDHPDEPDHPTSK